jgi:uncharacterized membrane protein YfbV (UPF0208 family)
MRVTANRRLPDSDKISYVLPYNRLIVVTETYKRLYPGSRVYLLWQVSVIGTAVSAIGIVLAEFWALSVAK